LPTAAPGTAPVLIYGDPRLRRVCREVAPDEDIGALAATMAQTMLAADGVGLAAPQIGDQRRVILCRDPGRMHEPPLVMINPVVEAHAGPRVSIEEGCLSFPGLYLRLWRPQSVQVRYCDLNGSRQQIRAVGLLARIIQHEVDHLEGVLFVDQLPRWRRWLLSWQLRRLQRLGLEAAA